MKLIVLLGPTASGKTDLSLKLAKKYNGEIVSADSRQVYRGLDVGSGKVVLRKGFANGIRHYLIDVANPKRTFTVAQYQRLAKRAVKQILSKGKIPMIVGGTGLYIESVIYNRQYPEVKPDLKLRKSLEKKTAQELFNILKKLDPQRAKTIDNHNPRRLIRAIEIAQVLKKVPSPGVPASPSESEAGERVPKAGEIKTLILGLKRSDQELRRLINKRVDVRVNGIIKEIKKLRTAGVSFNRLINYGLEYRYFSWYLQGKLSQAQAVAQLKTAVWHYGRRQYTWFRRLPVVWISNQQQAETKIKKFLQ